MSAARVRNRFIRSCMLRFDRSIIKHSYRTVLTSEGFLSYIFRKNAPREKIILLPNKLNTYFDEEKKKDVVVNLFDSNHINFAFIGLIRYPNTIIRFARVVGRNFPQHEFHFWGEPERDSYIDEEIKGFKNVCFHGKFKNPEDLLGIYSQIDISVVCYDTNSGNVRIAEPNKIYESIFFETPLVVSSGTYLAKRVKQYNAGFDIDASSDEEIKRFINSLKVEDIRKKVDSMKSIPWKDMVDDAIMLSKAINNYP